MESKSSTQSQVMIAETNHTKIDKNSIEKGKNPSFSTISLLENIPISYEFEKYKHHGVDKDIMMNNIELTNSTIVKIPLTPLNAGISLLPNFHFYSINR